ncbi:MAG: asparaginase [SAR202 cluster bacterium]|nr:asparaginase [SAR202 cluster bacterium]
MGGTIASTGSPRLVFAGYGGGPRLTIQQIVDRVPELKDFAQIKTEQYDTKGFPSPMDSLKVARRINQIFRDQPDTAGVVVTHGTAIMEETAYFLNLLVKSDKPVVITGAMRPPSAMGTDADNNLLCATLVAASPESRNKGCLLVLNDTIQAAREVTKQDSYRIDTFASREIGLLGYCDSDLRIVYYRSPTKKHTHQTEFDPDKIDRIPRVELVFCAPGSDGRLIRLAADDGAEGIVWAGAGAGDGPPGVAEAIDYARSKGVVVVVATRGGSGRVIRLKGYIERTLVAADNLIPQKAVALLMLALTRTKDVEEIQRMFEMY